MSAPAPSVVPVVVLDDGEIPPALRETTTPCDSLSALQLTASEAPFVAVVSHPVMALSQRIEAGQVPSEALRDWHARIAPCLAELRPLRRRVALVDRAALMAPTPDLVEALTARCPGLTVALVSERSDPVPPQALPFALIATLLLAQAPEAQALADELDAMTLTSLPMDLSQINALDQASQSLKTFHEEVALLRAEVADHLTAAEAHAQQARIWAEERSLLSEEIEDLSQRLGTGLTEERLQAAAAAAARVQTRQAVEDAMARETAFNRLLLQDGTDLAALQEEIRLLSSQRDDAEQALAETRKALQAAQDEVAALRTSTSWKVTGPIRAVKRGLGGDGT